MLELILASSSPRRRELIRELGRPFRVVAPEADENLPAGASPERAAEELASRKADSVARRLSEGIVIGADTLLVCRGKKLGKPNKPQWIGVRFQTGAGVQILARWRLA